MASKIQEVEKVSVSKAHQFIAELISMGHLQYLPIFERLEQEVTVEQKRTSLIERAHQVSSSKKPTFDNHSAF